MSSYMSTGDWSASNPPWGTGNVGGGGSWVPNAAGGVHWVPCVYPSFPIPTQPFDQSQLPNITIHSTNSNQFSLVFVVDADVIPGVLELSDCYLYVSEHFVEAHRKTIGLAFTPVAGLRWLRTTFHTKISTIRGSSIFFESARFNGSDLFEGHINVESCLWYPADRAVFDQARMTSQLSDSDLLKALYGAAAEELAAKVGEVKVEEVEEPDHKPRRRIQV